jgi:hypothetical protein
MIAKCHCQNCGGAIEYEAAEIAEGGQTVECPHCGKQTVLNILSVQSPKFFAWQQEQQQGPFDQETIQQMIAERKITSETLVRPEDGGLDWTPAKELFFPNSGSSWLDWKQATAPPNQQDAKKPGLAAGLREIWTDAKWLEQQKAKKEVPEVIGIFGIMFCFITGAILFFRGADEIASPEHDSVFPQIYGIIEVVGGF